MYAIIYTVNEGAQTTDSKEEERNMKIMRREELEQEVNAGRLHELHTSWTRGYVSRKGRGIVRPYNGRYGVGYVLLTPSWQSTTYCHITYYVA